MKKDSSYIRSLSWKLFFFFKFVVVMTILWPLKHVHFPLEAKFLDRENRDNLNIKSIWVLLWKMIAKPRSHNYEEKPQPTIYQVGSPL